MKKSNLLIIDDNKEILKALQFLLAAEFDFIKVISNPGQIHSELERTQFDVVLLDMNFKSGINTGNEGLFWLQEIKKRSPQTEVVMITAYGDVELAVKSLREGAFDFIIKPWDNDKLKATLNAACRLKDSNTQLVNLKIKESLLKQVANRSKPMVVGKSRAMKEIMTLVKKVADTDANVLITGENGTGKELIAREIHNQSNRSGELFVLVDLSSLSETLFESELFGHKKGAFTNAYEDKTGRFAMADKGTLFLDEIGNLPVNMQSKILTVLQTRLVSPVGSNLQVPVDFRLISATNKSLKEMLANNTFRQDLLYRMNTITIHLPPLRERTEDIEDIANHYLKVYCRKYNKPDLELSPEALLKLTKNPWYGNIRELQHTIEKAVILADGNKLKAGDFIFFEDEVILPDQVETLEEMEKKMIISTLKKNGFSQNITAEQLGITRQTLYNKLKKYGI
ncbi:MAG TPA: sigma-54 dependent transcriptional regulator [Bacteroidales bacterium]|nr:sigma-54 dependent transcriptional regulator [Bacteroidales bacterium]